MGIKKEWKQRRCFNAVMNEQMGRENLCLTYGPQVGFEADAVISGRMECAIVPLDQATLKQLLRTQTV